MIKLKQEKLADSKKSHFLFKVILAGLFLLSVLPFSFGQDFNFRDVVETRFKGKHFNKEFKSFLDSMELEGSEYFNSNCSQKSSHKRSTGKYKAKAGPKEYYEVFNIFYEAYLDIQKCDQIDSLIYLEIILNMDNLLDYKGNNDISKSHLYSAMTSIVEGKEQSTDETFIKTAAAAQGRLCEYYRFDQKDFDRALTHGMKSLSMFNKYPYENDKPLRSLNSLSRTYTNMGNLSQAIFYSNEVLKYAEKLNLTKDRYNSDVYFRISSLYLDLNEYEKMDSIHRLIAQKFPNKKYYQIDYQRAGYELKKGNYKVAEKYYLETINQINNKTKNFQRLTREISNARCKLYTALNDNDKALELSFNAMNKSAIVIPDSMNSFLLDFSKLTIIDPLEFLNSVNNYLRIVSKKDIIPEVEFLNTIDKLDSIYFEIQPTIVGPIAANDIGIRYHEMVDMALQYSKDIQFEEKNRFISYYLSSGKSLSLFSNFIMKENIPKSQLDGFDKLLSAQKKVTSDIAKAKRNNNQNRIDSLANVLYDLNKNLKKYYSKINEKNLTSDYRKNRFEAIENLKSNFNNGEVVLDFFEHEDHFYAYSFFDNEINFHQFELPKVEGESLKEIYKNEKKYKELDFFNKSFSEIILSFLPNDKSNISSIIIIPDGKLLEIPFETIEYDGKELIRSFPIHYFNSINDHYKRSNKELNPNKPYAGFGLAYNETLKNNINSSGEIKSIFDNSFRLASLPNAIQELETSNQIFGGSLYTEDECTSEQFIENAPEANIIHIANHVLLNNTNSFLSSIVFAENNKEDLFNALDVKALNLNAQLAILSSCNSGVGENFTGNGLRSIGQSFFEAGCQSVVANLWEAGDKSSKKIISGFMKYLKEGMNKSEALRQAKINFLEQATDAEKHPKFWANIVLIGSDDPISFSKHIPYWMIIAIGGISILGLIFGIRKLKKEAA